MPDFNLITITKQPDPTTKIITLDIINDGIKDNDILRNVELIVDGTELKGIEFLTSGDPLEFGDNSRSIIMSLRTPDDVPACTVRHLAAGVAEVSQIFVSGSEFADALLTPANSIGIWSYDETDENYHTRLNLYAPLAPSTICYSGTTAGSGTYSETFAVAYVNAPNVQASLVGGSVNQFALVTSRSNTGFTVTTYTRSSVTILGSEVLLASTSATNGLDVDVLVTSND